MAKNKQNGYGQMDSIAPVGSHKAVSAERDIDLSTHKVNYLIGTELFQDFTPKQLIEYHVDIKMRSCKAGYVFYIPGETGEVLFMIKKGSAQLYKMAPDGRKFVLAQLPPGSMFGEMSFVGQGMYDCFAEATADALICTMSRYDVLKIIRDYPQFAIRLLESLGKRIVRAEKQLEDLAFRGLVPRLADFILSEEKDGILRGFSHQDIAERLGVYRETTTYALNELKSAGVLEIGRRKVTIKDRKRLEIAAKEY